MANITIQNNDNNSVLLSGDALWRDATINFPSALTYASGTILAYESDALTVTASAVTGTGNGTVTAATVVTGPVVPLVGAYTLTVNTAVANGGKWTLKDPNGQEVDSNLIMTVGAGAATVFKAGGLQFTITDGSTDFAAGDTATLTVASLGKYVAFSGTGAGGAQIASAVLTYPITSAGSGDVAARVLISGTVNFNRLIIQADGNNTNVTTTVLDQLRAGGIFSQKVKQLALIDNPQS